VVLLPLRDLLPCIGQIGKPVLVQALIAEASVDAFQVTVWKRLDRNTWNFLLSILYTVVRDKRDSGRL
jgi:hypothetical protein